MRINFIRYLLIGIAFVALTWSVVIIVGVCLMAANSDIRMHKYAHISTFMHYGLFPLLGSITILIFLRVSQQGLPLKILAIGVLTLSGVFEVKMNTAEPAHTIGHALMDRCDNSVQLLSLAIGIALACSSPLLFLLRVEKMKTKTVPVE